jgi:aquaporin Z
MVGTALLLLIGLSLVIVMFGDGSPMANLIPDVKLRQMITGFLFGSTGALIAISSIGKTSGAHINPAVTMAFWLFQKINSRTAIAYVLAQLIGAVIGTLPLLLWGQMGKSISFGATLPGEGYTMQTVLLGEVITTFTMVSLAYYIYRVQANPCIHACYLSCSVCNYDPFGSGDLRNQHQSCP